MLHSLNYFKTWGNCGQEYYDAQIIQKSIGGRCYQNYDRNIVNNAVDAVRYRKNVNLTFLKL